MGFEDGSAASTALNTLNGLEFMRAVLDGGAPAAPMATTMGFALVEVSEGRSVFRGAPGPDVYNPIGSVHGGWVGTMLDSCMGCAVHTTLAQGIGYTTLEYKVNLVRALSHETGTVDAIGTVISSGRRIAVAEGQVVDGQGNILAHGTTTCLIFPFDSDIFFRDTI